MFYSTPLSTKHQIIPLKTLCKRKKMYDNICWSFHERFINIGQGRNEIQRSVQANQAGSSTDIGLISGKSTALTFLYFLISQIFDYQGISLVIPPPSG